MADRIALDTVTLIDMLEGEGDRYKVLAPLIKRAEMGIVEFIVSEVSIAEVNRLDSGEGLTVETINAFLAAQYFRRIPVTPEVSEKAAQLVRDHDLETCDALILATALLRKSDILYTRDGEARKKIRNSKQIPLGVGTSLEGMKIRHPLFDENLCRDAGVTPKPAQKSGDNERKEAAKPAEAEARSRPGHAEGGRDGLAGGGAPRPQQAEAAGRVARVAESDKPQEG